MKKWIASALGTSPSSVQSFRSRNAICRRTTTSTLHNPKDFSSYEGVLEPAGSGVWFDPEIGSDPRWQKRWRSIERVELRLTPTRIVLLRRGGAKRPVSKHFSIGSSTKSGKGRRVRLTQRAVAALKDHRKRQLEERMCLAGLWQDRDLIFPILQTCATAPSSA